MFLEFCYPTHRAITYVIPSLNLEDTIIIFLKTWKGHISSSVCVLDEFNFFHSFINPKIEAVFKPENKFNANFREKKVLFYIEIVSTVNIITTCIILRY